jgi:hypothetical protein
MADFFVNILKLTSIQIISVLGLFFILGFLISKIQELTQKQYYKTIGWKGILWTAWIGTPFHEFGHYFFAKIFRHKIIRVKIFEPNQITGELGYVNHVYNKHSLYQKIGNFFIGAAPMIFGSSMLALLVYFLLPNGKEIFNPLVNTSSSVEQIILSLKNTTLALFSAENLSKWNFWVFLYFSFSVSSHLAPSKPDQKTMWHGFVYIFVVLFLINIFAVLLRLDITEFILKYSQYLGIFTAFFFYAFIVSTIHLIFSKIILNLLKR